MFNTLSLKKYCLTTLVFLVIASANQIAMAECEDFQDSDFPSAECSFDDLGVNKQMLKFGDVDEVSSQSGTISVRFGSATYSVSNSAEIHVAFDDDSCIRANDFGFNLQEINDNFSPVDEVAFIPSATNSREIERIWVFRCDSIQFQSR